MSFSLPIPAPGKTERVSDLHAGADSLALSRLARALKKPLVIVWIYGNGVNGPEGVTAGNHLIVGGSGVDTIYGAFGSVNHNGGEGGRNLIVGGGGADTIYASQNANGAEGGFGSILVAGTTSLNQTALQAVLAEWTSTHSYAQRLANIQGQSTAGFASRLNGTNYLTAGQTVANDSAADKLWGETTGDPNWYFYRGSQDTVGRTKAGESLTVT